MPVATCKEPAEAEVADEPAVPAVPLAAQIVNPEPVLQDPIFEMYV